MRFLLALLLRQASSCAFSRSGLPKPAAHPATASALPFAPGVPYADSHNDSHYPYPGYDMPSGDWLIPRLVANLSAQSGTALCYWSQQVLPSPPTGFDPNTGGCTPSPCAWTTPPPAADVEQLLALGEQASGAMQYMIDASLRAGGVPSFVGSQCGSGFSNAQVLCRDVDPQNPICNATGLQQRSEWAVASNILVMAPETLNAVYCEARIAGCPASTLRKMRPPPTHTHALLQTPPSPCRQRHRVAHVPPAAHPRHDLLPGFQGVGRGRRHQLQVAALRGHTRPTCGAQLRLHGNGPRHRKAGLG